MADVAQLVGDPLELGAVIVDGEVALHHGTQLGLKIHRALHLIVLKNPLDCMPEGERVVAVTTDDVKDTLGYGGEYPVDDAGVDHAPLAIAIGVGRRRADVALDAELGKSGIEEVPPLAVIAFVEVEDDRDMVADGEGLDLRGRDGDGGEAIIGGV